MINDDQCGRIDRIDVSPLFPKTKHARTGFFLVPIWIMIRIPLLISETLVRAEGKNSEMIGPSSVQNPM